MEQRMDNDHYNPCRACLFVFMCNTVVYIIHIDVKVNAGKSVARTKKYNGKERKIHFECSYAFTQTI